MGWGITNLYGLGNNQQQYSPLHNCTTCLLYSTRPNSVTAHRLGYKPHNDAATATAIAFLLCRLLGITDDGPSMSCYS